MKYWRTRTAAPATCGVAMLVPHMVRRPQVAAAGWGRPAAEVAWPGATSSGLMRPSCASSLQRGLRDLTLAN